MSKININLKSLEENEKILNKHIDSFKECITFLNSNLKNIDTTWNDYNTNLFIDKINKDKITFIDYCETLEIYLKEIESFKDEIENLFQKSLNINNIKKIRYDSDVLNSALNYLNNSYNKLKEALNNLKRIKIPASFKYKYLIENYKYDVNNDMNNIYKIKVKLSNINKSIDNIIGNKKVKINNIDFKNIDSNVITYNWKTTNSNLNKINTDDDIKLEIIEIN